MLIMRDLKDEDEPDCFNSTIKLRELLFFTPAENDFAWSMQTHLIMYDHVLWVLKSELDFQTGLAKHFSRNSTNKFVILEAFSIYGLPNGDRRSPTVSVKTCLEKLCTKQDQLYYHTVFIIIALVVVILVIILLKCVIF